MRCSDCVFCKISSGQIISEFIHESKTCFAIRDIHPIASTHVLIIPRIHIPHLEFINHYPNFDFNDMYSLAVEIALRENVINSGYRLVINQKEDSGQEVEHLHLHLIGGKKLKVMG